MPEEWKKAEILALAALFLFAVWMWTLPIQKLPMPYGEVDSAHHYGLAEYMASNDIVTDKYPFFMYYRYGLDNAVMPGHTAYAPHFFVNEAIAMSFGGDEVKSYFIFLSILDTLIILSSFFLIKKLFGFWPAFLSSLLIAFSRIEILTHLMGQYVVLISFAATPLVFYCYYKYTESHLGKKPRFIYLVLMAFMLAVQFTNHTQAIFNTLIVLVLFNIFLIVKERKLPFDTKHALIAILIFFIILGPFVQKAFQAQIQLGETYTGPDVSKGLGNLFRWYGEGYQQIAVGSDIFSYGAMHALWTLPLLLLGMIFVFIRRKNKDLLLLSWIVGLYMLFHLDLFTGGTMKIFSASRLFRSISDVPHIFYPLAAIGMLSIASFIPLSKKLASYAKYALIGIFILLVIFMTAPVSFRMLDQAYPIPARMNPYQYEAAMWMRQNIPEETFLINYGTLTQQAKRFTRDVAQRHIIEDPDGITFIQDTFGVKNLTISYVIVDYSDLVLLSRNYNTKPDIERLQQFENATLGNAQLVYDKNYVKVYKVA